MRQVKSQATNKRGPPSDTGRRDMIHGTIDSLIHKTEVSKIIQSNKKH